MRQYMPPKVMPISKHVELSIIYVNWNSSHYVIPSIASIYQHTTGVEFEIIVVDNASPAENAELLKREFDEITLVKSPANIGFAGANNLGFRHSSGRYILFLNPDTKLIAPAIGEMVEAVKSSDNAGVVGCKLLNADGSVQTSCVQAFPTILNHVLDAEVLRQRWPSLPIWRMQALFSSDSPAKAEVISGACMLIRREVFEEVGQFSDAYFMYAEDLDLCYRVASAGYSNLCVNTVSVIHYGGGSSTPSTATVRKWHSILQYLFTHRGHAYTLTFRFVMSMVAILRLGLLGAVGACRGRQARNGGFAAFDKWAAILRILLTFSGRAPVDRPRTADCAPGDTSTRTKPVRNAMRI
jgi:GT2 family glycosyltransferase